MKKKLVFVLLFLCGITLSACDDAKISSIIESLSESTSSVIESSSNESSSIAESSSISSSDSSSLIESSSVVSDIVLEYYKDIDINNSTNDFRNSLTSLINNRFNSVSYSSLNNYLKLTDPDPNKSGNIICFYTGQSLATGAWNKEHVWAKSHGFGDEKYEAYSDAHHLRPTLNSINTSRDNLDFDEVSNYSSSYSNDNYGNKWNSVCFEPRDEVKGDVARIMMYMEIKYNNIDGLKLTISDSIPTSTSTGNGSLGKLSTLLKWNYQDPVSEQEIYRNNVIYEFQNNRNPFIDHPEYVDYAFPNEYASDVTVDDSKVAAVVTKINTIPEAITLDTETLINECYLLYNALNFKEKAAVTNYSILSNANTTLSALKEASSVIDGNTIVFDFATQNSTFPTAYTSNVQVTVNEHNFLLSNTGYFGAYLRLGNKNATTLAASSPLNPTSSAIDASYLELQEQISKVKGVTFDFSTAYGTITSAYILYSIDDGVTYQTLTQTATIGTSLSGTFENPTDCRIALVIIGSKPRLDLAGLKIITEK